MKATINRADGRVTVDGETYTVDLASLPAYVSVIQWFGDKGHIEFINGGGGQFLPNVAINDFAPYTYVVERWQAAKKKVADEKAEQEKKEAEEQAALERERKKEKAEQPRQQRGVRVNG